MEIFLEWFCKQRKKAIIKTRPAARSAGCSSARSQLRRPRAKGPCFDGTTPKTMLTFHLFFLVIPVLNSNSFLSQRSSGAAGAPLPARALPWLRAERGGMLGLCSLRCACATSTVQPASAAQAAMPAAPSPSIRLLAGEGFWFPLVVVVWNVPVVAEAHGARGLLLIMCSRRIVRLRWGY